VKLRRVLLAGLVTIAAACTAGRRDAAPPVSPTAARATETHGIWVWKIGALLDAPGGVAGLVAACQRAGVNEAYLSVPSAVLSDARFPALVDALAGAGVRVEALMGDAVWYQPEHLPELLARIDAVAAYDAAHRGRAFTAIHLDVEPHQLAENHGVRGYMPAFVAMVQAARARAASSGLALSVDVPRMALTRDADDRRALVASGARLFLMLYELRSRSYADAEASEDLARATADVIRVAYEGDADASARMVVGLSAEDYGARLPKMLRAVDDANQASPRYAGWAIHDYQSYAGTPH
jgi:hypothetical protein